MFEGKARRLAASIQERAGGPDGGGVTAEVEVHARSPESTAPGAGPVRFTWYEIRVSDGTRIAGLEVDEAAALLEEMAEGCGADRVFQIIESFGVPVEPLG